MSEENRGCTYLVWRYSKGLGEYLKMMDVFKYRQIDISPFLVAAAKGVKIPVTPLINPTTRFSSHFIIRMIDHKDETYKVDCLIRDSDLYFVGFRRWLMLKKEEKLKGWSRWYTFAEEDIVLPDMFDAIRLPVKAGYNQCDDVRPGGIETIRTMFLAFARYPEGTVKLDDLQIACFCFMATVPESTRQLSVKCELIKLIFEEKPPSPVSGKLYEGMHSWNKKSTFVLEQRRDNLLLSHHRVPSEKSWASKPFDLVQMRDVIGENGELLLINHNRSLMGIPTSKITKMQEEALRKVGFPHQKDPGFREDYEWRK